MTGELLLIAILILIQGFFSGSEIAIVSSDRLVLRNRADDGDAGAERVLRLLQHPARLVGTCLIGTNLALIAGYPAPDCTQLRETRRRAHRWGWAIVRVERFDLAEAARKVRT